VRRRRLKDLVSRISQPQLPRGLQDCLEVKRTFVDYRMQEDILTSEVRSAPEVSMHEEVYEKVD